MVKAPTITFETPPQTFATQYLYQKGIECIVKEFLDKLWWQLPDWLRHRVLLINSYRIGLERAELEEFMKGELKRCPRAKGYVTCICRDCGYEWITVPWCNTEICPVCGCPGSVAHRRRVSRTRDVIEYFVRKYGFIGYMVITFPDDVIAQWRSRKDIKKVEQYIKKKIKRDFGGVNKGVLRWHWAGDERRGWRPHLNIIWTQAWIPKEKLEKFRSDLEKYFNSKIVIKHKYISKKQRNYEKKVLHLVKYVMRPTLWLMVLSPKEMKKLQKNYLYYLELQAKGYNDLLEEMMEKNEKFVKGTKNVVWFGQFSEAEKQEIQRIREERESLLQEVCQELEFKKDKASEKMKRKIQKRLAFLRLCDGRCPYCGSKNVVRIYGFYNDDKGVLRNFVYDDELGVYVPRKREECLLEVGLWA